MATTPSYAATAATVSNTISAANTNRDGTGTIVTILTAAAAGTRIDKIDIQATATTTAGVVRLYIHDGTTALLWKEILVSATTPSTTVAAWSYTLYETIVLKTGYSLRASTHNAETFRVHVTMAGDLT